MQQPALPSKPSSTRLAWARRLALGIVGAVVCASSVGFLIRADLGVTPLDVLTTGIVDTAGVSLALVITVMQIVLVGAGLALGSRIGVMTVLFTFGGGIVAQIAVDVVPESDHLALRAALMVVGIVGIALGVSLMLLVDLGTPGYEMVMMGLVGKGYPLRWVRTVMEVIAVVAGLALGGAFGVATVIIAFGLGHIIAGWLRLFGRADLAGEARVLDDGAPL